MRFVVAVVALLLTCEAATPQAAELTVRELYSIITERDRAYNQRFEAQEKAVAAALAAAKEAVSKAETAAEKRFDSVNEFRNSLKDQQATYMTRVEADARFKAIDDKAAANEKRLAIADGKAEGVNWLIGIVIAIGTFSITVAGAVGFMRRQTPTA